MAVFTSSRLPGPTGRHLLSRVCAARDREFSRQVRRLRVGGIEWGRPAVQMAVAAALAAVSAGPVLAAVATGTWSGQWSCRQRAEVTVTRTGQRASTMLIAQRGAEVFIALDGTPYRGVCHDSARNPSRATCNVVRSTTDGQAFSHLAEAITLKIRINDARGTAKIRAQSTVQDARGQGHCTYRFSRTSREDPGDGLLPQDEFCGDGLVDAPNEECDGAATGTPCDGACTTACTCPRPCEPLEVNGHWEGAWVSEVTGESGPVVANLEQEGFALGTISFPPFRDVVYSAPLVMLGACAPAEISTGALLRSGVVGTLDGIATNTSMAGTWRLSDQSDYGTWQLSR